MRFTPTRAWGKCSGRLRVKADYRFTPHARGENVLSVLSGFFNSGFTPTRVGKISAIPALITGLTVHPYARGENVWSRSVRST